MLRLSLILCLGFGLGGIVCAIQYFMIRVGRFHRNPYLGLPGYAQRSDRAWSLAHQAAAPWIGRAGILAAAAAVIAGIGLLTRADTEFGEGFLITSGLFGAMAAGVYLLGANGAAHDATKRIR